MSRAVGTPRTGTILNSHKRHKPRNHLEPPGPPRQPGTTVNKRERHKPQERLKCAGTPRAPGPLRAPWDVMSPRPARSSCPPQAPGIAVRASGTREHQEPWKSHEPGSTSGDRKCPSPRDTLSRGAASSPHEHHEPRHHLKTLGHYEPGGHLSFLRLHEPHRHLQPWVTPNPGPESAHNTVLPHRADVASGSTLASNQTIPVRRLGANPVRAFLGLCEERGRNQCSSIGKGSLPCSSNIVSPRARL